MRAIIYSFVFLVGCGGKNAGNGSLCDRDPVPAACDTECDPAAANTCPLGFHCASDGQCDAECTQGGTDCGQGSFCSDDGTCQPGTPVDEACKHIDVVIAVDNSGSMSEEKSALRDIAFPGFATALINVAGGIEDFRVGVLDACPDPANFHTRGVGGECNFQSGLRWMESSSTALVDEFKCVGDIFSGDQNCNGSNDDEQPATAATTALEPAFSGSGMPNEGFLRDNALLVVIAITDEDEQPTPNANAQEIYDRLVAIKGGDVNRMVFLGIAGDSACSGAYGDAKEATKLKATTQLFIDAGRGVFYDLCLGDLEDGLTQALTTIDSACRDFGPIL
jgi:hypothetical protein